MQHRNRVGKIAIETGVNGTLEGPIDAAVRHDQRWSRRSRALLQNRIQSALRTIQEVRVSLCTRDEPPRHPAVAPTWPHLIGDLSFQFTEAAFDQVPDTVEPHATPTRGQPRGLFRPLERAVENGAKVDVT